MRDTPHNAPVTSEEATRIAEQAEASFTSGDLNAIMSHYADGAVMFDASHANLSTDRKVQAGWAQSFVSMKPGDYHVPDRQIQILGPDAFISSGIRNLHGRRGGGAADRQRQVHRRLQAAEGRQLEDRQRACVDAAEHGAGGRQ